MVIAVGCCLLLFIVFFGSPLVYIMMQTILPGVHIKSSTTVQCLYKKEKKKIHEIIYPKQDYKNAY